MTANETPVDMLRTAVFYLVVGVLAWLVYLIFLPLLAPLAWACILVVMFHPLQARLERRMGKNAAAALNTLLITIILVAPSLVLLTAFVRQGFAAATAAQGSLSTGGFEWANAPWRWVQQHFPNMQDTTLPMMVRQEGERIARTMAAEVGSVLRNAFYFLFDLIVMLLAVFYILRDSDSLMKGFRGVMPFTETQREGMIAEADELIHASVVFTLISAAVHGLVGGAIFAAVGIPEALFWGVAMAFFSLLPVVGSSIIWLPAMGYLLTGGHYGMAIAVGVVCAGTALLMENVVRPWVISGRAELSSLVVFISVLGGLTVFGLLGVVLGPIIVATATSVLDIYRNRDADSPPGGTPRGAGPAMLQ